LASLLAAVPAFPTLASATLIDRGGGLIYDTGLQITWLQYSFNNNPSGYHWPNAMTFAANYAYFGPVRQVNWDDWRLPWTTGNGNGEMKRLF
jgi:hypothetical protein